MRIKCPICAQKVQSKNVVSYTDRHNLTYTMCGPCAYYEEVLTNEQLNKKIEDLKKALRLVLKK